MTPDRLFETAVSEEEYDTMADKYISIAPGPTGENKEGDTIVETVELGLADWKKPGVSLSVPVNVVSAGMNQGKTDFWYPGIGKDAMSVTKRALKIFGIEDKVLVKKDGKIFINPTGFAGARGRARWVRSKTNNNNLIAKLDSLNFLPLATSETKDIGI